jgi:hypothetical protein
VHRRAWQPLLAALLLLAVAGEGLAQRGQRGQSSRPAATKAKAKAEARPAAPTRPQARAARTAGPRNIQVARSAAAESRRRAIAEAVTNSDPAYLAKVLAQRNPGNDNRGSRFSRPMTVETLLEADWRPYRHPAVGKGVEAYRASIPGRVGMLELASLPPDTPVRLEDFKGVGHLSAIVPWRGELPRVAHSVLLVGRGKDGRRIVYTVHPGDPVRAASVRNPALAGRTVTAREALDLGFSLAKAGEP